MKISAVCFDLGKVLLDFDKEAMLARIAEKSPLTAAEMTPLFLEDEQALIHERGGITSAQYFSHLKKLLRYRGAVKELRACYCEIFTPLSDHIALAAQLAPHYPLVIISNTNDAHIVYAETAYSFFSLFHARIYSHEVRAMKPERKIFDAALAALGGIDPLEALFIDDIEAHVLAASKLGWQTIHLRPDVNLREALASYELQGLD